MPYTPEQIEKLKAADPAVAKKVLARLDPEERAELMESIRLYNQAPPLVMAPVPAPAPPPAPAVKPTAAGAAVFAPSPQEAQRAKEDEDLKQYLSPVQRAKRWVAGQTEALVKRVQANPMVNPLNPADPISGAMMAAVVPPAVAGAADLGRSLTRVPEAMSTAVLSAGEAVGDLLPDNKYTENIKRTRRELAAEAKGKSQKWEEDMTKILGPDAVRPQDIVGKISREVAPMAGLGAQAVYAPGTLAPYMGVQGVQQATEAGATGGEALGYGGTEALRAAWLGGMQAPVARGVESGVKSVLSRPLGATGSKIAGVATGLAAEGTMDAALSAASKRAFNVDPNATFGNEFISSVGTTAAFRGARAFPSKASKALDKYKSDVAFRDQPNLDLNLFIERPNIKSSKTRVGVAEDWQRRVQADNGETLTALQILHNADATFSPEARTEWLRWQDQNAQNHDFGKPLLPVDALSPEARAFGKAFQPILNTQTKLYQERKAMDAKPKKPAVVGEEGAVPELEDVPNPFFVHREALSNEAPKFEGSGTGIKTYDNSMLNRENLAAIDPEGNVHVVKRTPDGEFVEFVEGRKDPDKLGGLKVKDEKTGILSNDWKLGTATRDQISEHLGTQYSPDPVASTLKSTLGLSRAIGGERLLEHLKSSDMAQNILPQQKLGALGEAGKPERPELKQTKGLFGPRADGKSGVMESLRIRKENFRELTPQAKKLLDGKLDGYAFDPRVAQFIEDTVGGTRNKSEALTKINDAVINLSFNMNPLLHWPNMTDHFIKSIGVEGMTTGADRVQQLMQESNFDVKAFHRGEMTPFMKEWLANGGPLMSAGGRVKDAKAALNEALGKKAEPDTEQDLTAADVTPLQSSGNQGSVSRHVTWIPDDIMRITLAKNWLAKNPGKSVAEAIREISRSFPDYSTTTLHPFSYATHNQLTRATSAFMNFRYGSIKASLATLKDLGTFGKGKGKTQLNALNKVAGTATAAALIYPVMDELLKAVSGDTEAEYRRGGFSHNIHNVKDLVNTGDLPRYLQSFYISTPTSNLIEKVRTGKTVNPGDFQDVKQGAQNKWREFMGEAGPNSPQTKLDAIANALTQVSMGPAAANLAKTTAEEGSKALNMMAGTAAEVVTGSKSPRAAAAFTFLAGRKHRSEAQKVLGEYLASKIPMHPPGHEQAAIAHQKKELKETLRAKDEEKLSAMVASGTVSPKLLSEQTISASDKLLAFRAQARNVPFHTLNRIDQAGTTEEKRMISDIWLAKMSNEIASIGDQPGKAELLKAFGEAVGKLNKRK